MGYLYEKTTYQIRGILYETMNKLRSGLVESIYQNFIYDKLNKLGIRSIKKFPVHIYYKDYEVGYYKTDILVRKK